MRQSFNCGEDKLIIVHSEYTRGRLAIRLIDQHREPYTTLTVNVPEVDLLPGEFVVRPEGQEYVIDAALESGLFVDTGRRVAVGREEGHVWMYSNRESYPVGAAAAA